jgi:peptidoglycan/LPS O-acetylase OafA/YrhL
MKIAYSKRIFGLDLMRCVAILCVVFSHALWIFPNATGPLKDLLTLMGVLGVEIFFVLSGFLIGTILYKSMVLNVPTKKTISHFWLRRWFRTLPNYYLILVVNIGIVLFIGRELPESLWQYFFFLQNFSSAMDIFFTESWSLPIEEFAYLLGPLLLFGLLLVFKNKSRKQLFLGATLTILCLFLFTKVYYHFFKSQPDMYFWNEHLKTVTIYRLDAIFYGFLGVYVAINFKEFWTRYAILFAGLGGFMLLLLNFGIPYLGWFIDVKPIFWNVWYLPINSFAILCFLPWLSNWKTSRGLLRFGVTRISLISYSMYLLHYSVILQLLRYFFPIDQLSTLDKVIYVVAYLLSTFVLSYVLYRIFEKPMTDLRDKPFIMRWFGLKPKKLN